MAIVNNNAVLLKNYPIKFGNTALDFFPQLSRQISKVVNKQQSEGGKDLVQTIRVKKFSFPLSCSVADDTWCGFFEQYYEMDSFVLSVYSTRTHAYETHTVRMEGLSIVQQKGSEDLTSVTGTWNVSFTLEEF